MKGELVLANDRIISLLTFETFSDVTAVKLVSDT